MQYAELLTAHEVRAIHEASLEILATDGLQVRLPAARGIFARHGCPVDNASGRVHLPAPVVEDLLQGLAPTFTFTGRTPEFDRTLPADRPVVVTGSSAPNVVDPDTGRERRSTSADIAAIARLVDALPGYDVFSISTLADDAPPGMFSLSRFYPALKNCRKPVRSNTPHMADLLQVLELGALVAGGAEAYRRRPLITHHYCPLVSPLTMDRDSTEAYIYLVEQGLPVYATVTPSAGMTAPFTLAATLALGNAEFLALACLMQMIRPGAPTIYAVLSTAADMRTGNYTPGAIETGLLQMGHAQMARFYNVPSGGYIGLTNSQRNDAQCGYETGMNTTAATLAGTDMLNMGGLLGGLMAFDFAKAVIDDEIARMLKQMATGLPCGPEAIALEEIHRAGPGGSHMDSDVTMARLHRTAFYPDLAVRDRRDTWKAAGRPDSQSRALARARTLLSGDHAARLDPTRDAAVRQRFEGVVPGDPVWP